MELVRCAEGERAAAEVWTHLPASDTTGRALTELFCPQAQSRLKKMLRAALTETDKESVTLPGPLSLLCGATAAQLTLLPLRRIADYVELVVVLVKEADYTNGK